MRKYMADKEVSLIQAKKTPEKDVNLDTQGFFVIEVDSDQKNIRVEFYSNVYKKIESSQAALKKFS